MIMTLLDTRWAVHTEFYSGKPEGKRSLGRRTDVEGRIILNCILMKWCVKVWPWFIWLRTGASDAVRGTRLSDSIKSREFLDQLSDY